MERPYGTPEGNGRPLEGRVRGSEGQRAGSDPSAQGKAGEGGPAERRQVGKGGGGTGVGGECMARHCVSHKLGLKRGLACAGAGVAAAPWRACEGR